jgi:hypothetical protein
VKNKDVKIVVLDIETMPVLAQVWDIWDQNVGLNQIVKDWAILAFAYKELNAPSNEVVYMDNRGAKDLENDSKLLKALWKVMDEADVIIGQNSKAFDVKKINTRFAMNGMKPPSSFKQADTCLMAKKHFAFTSNKLEYLSDKLNTKYKKSSHKKFPGHTLWSQCIKGNKEAWNAMKAYNIFDVLATEELFNKLKAWENPINYDLYTAEGAPNVCSCGNKRFLKNGYFYSSQGKFQRYKCSECNSETRDKVNLLSKIKKASLKLRVNR